MNVLFFLAAGSVLLVAQSLLVVREVRAARSRGPDAEREGRTVDAAWAALPGLMALALFGYSLLQSRGG